MENTENQIIVDEIRAKKPDEVQAIEDMFNACIAKTNLLTNNFSKKEVDKDLVSRQVVDFLIEIRKIFVENWCAVEKLSDIIGYLEQTIVEMGGNMEEVTSKYQNK